MVDSAFSGRLLSTARGNGKETKFMEGVLGRRAMLRGVEMKEMVWPFVAMSLES